MALTHEIAEVPVWAREEAFPAAPPAWGWADPKGRLHPCDSLDALSQAIRDDQNGGVALVWRPETPRMVLPEELPEMVDALRVARERWTKDDLENARHRIRLFGLVGGGIGLYSLFLGFSHAGQLAKQVGTGDGFLSRLEFAAHATLASPQVGIALLLFVVFAFIPWYQARKRCGELGSFDSVAIAAAVPALRLETWLERQKAPVTKLILGIMAVVGIAQLYAYGKASGVNPLSALLHNWGGIGEAGLMKDQYAQGEWWRIFTAPLMHGNLVHFLMNASALAYLGKRLEVFARWPHLPLVFLFAAYVGGEASARFVQAPSVGASGGLMGWLGFLLVFETLHKTLVPRRASRRLLAGVFLTALIGVIGYRYIDNAAHAGGLLAGMVYALIVFPKSASAVRPKSGVTDYIAGSMALAVLMFAGLLAVVRMMVGW